MSFDISIVSWHCDKHVLNVERVVIVVSLGNGNGVFSAFCFGFRFCEEAPTAANCVVCGCYQCRAGYGYAIVVLSVGATCMEERELVAVLFVFLVATSCVAFIFIDFRRSALSSLHMTRRWVIWLTRSQDYLLWYNVLIAVW